MAEQQQHLITADFFGNPVSIIDHDGQQWLTAEQAGRCLGYSEAQSRKAVVNLYNKHADEFSEDDMSVIELMTEAGLRECRIFSSTGCSKLGFFARTARAKEFRTWASKVLSKKLAAPVAPAPVPAPVVTLAPVVEGALTTLASGMTRVLAQMNVTGKYIELLEMNQTAKRRVTREVVAEVFTLRAQGLATNDIARLLRVSRTAVSSIIQEKFAGLDERSQPAERSLDDVLEDWITREKAKLTATLKGGA
jgi:hypothetical protein